MEETTAFFNGLFTLGSVLPALSGACLIVALSGYANEYPMLYPFSIIFFLLAILTGLISELRKRKNDASLGKVLKLFLLISVLELWEFLSLIIILPIIAGAFLLGPVAGFAAFVSGASLVLFLLSDLLDVINTAVPVYSSAGQIWIALGVLCISVTAFSLILKTGNRMLEPFIGFMVRTRGKVRTDLGRNVPIVWKEG